LKMPLALLLSSLAQYQLSARNRQT